MSDNNPAAGFSDDVANGRSDPQLKEQQHQLYPVKHSTKTAPAARIHSQRPSAHLLQSPLLFPAFLRRY